MPRSIQDIQLLLQTLVSEAEYDLVLEKLEELVSDDPENRLRQDILLVKARYTEAVRDGNLDLIDLRELDKKFSHVAKALLWLIDRLRPDNLRETLQQNKRHIPRYHALTCDRAPQKTAFDEHYFFDPGPAVKFRFFYLYGDTRQELESLYTRFAYDRSGLINNRWRQGEQPASRQPLFKWCKPECSESPRMFEMYILRDLFACFFDPVDQQQINPDCRLTSLLESPEIKQLGPDDHVFVLFTMDDFNWRKEVTPLVVKRLFDGFYNCPLPPESPKFYFFFGLEYTKTNEEVKKEVREAVHAAEYGIALQELTPVAARDLAEWFSRYKELCNGLEPAAASQQYFPNQTLLDMADVEPTLTALIEKFNKGQL